MSIGGLLTGGGRGVSGILVEGCLQVAGPVVALSAPVGEEGNETGNSVV